MEHWKNLSLKDIVEEFNGIIYTEKWKYIKGYEWQYKVSTFGRVKSVKRKVSHYRGGLLKKSALILSQGLDRYGYPQVSLCKNGISSCRKVHQLVANAFIKNKELKPTVNHKFGIKQDNRVHQLEWFTVKEQTIHASRVLKRKMGIQWQDGDKHPMSKKVKQIDIYGGIVAVYSGTREAQRVTGINRCTISQVCNKNNYYKTAGGYKWEYA